MQADRSRHAEEDPAPEAPPGLLRRDLRCQLARIRFLPERRPETIGAHVGHPDQDEERQHQPAVKHDAVHHQVRRKADRQGDIEQSRIDIAQIAEALTGRQEQATDGNQQQRDEGQDEPAQVPAVETVAGDEQEGRGARDQAELLLGTETRPQRHPVELLQCDPQHGHEQSAEDGAVPDETEHHHDQINDSGQRPYPEITHSQLL